MILLIDDRLLNDKLYSSWSKSLFIHANLQYFFFLSQGPGVYFGSFDFNGQSRDNLTTDSHLLPYPSKEQEPFLRPMAVVLTEFHVLLLFQDRLVSMKYWGNAYGEVSVRWVDMWVSEEWGTVEVSLTLTWGGSEMILRRVQDGFRMKCVWVRERWGWG